ncbi:MAG: hypothetical protein RBR68_15245, partial [Tenuifilaceae bacterium]|nr:hypothetical protein [Tenuifilaceae bacterium]
LHNHSIFKLSYNNTIEIQCYISKNLLSGWTIVNKKVKKEGWINILRNPNYICSQIFNSEKDAKDYAYQGDLLTIKVNWEE